MRGFGPSTTLLLLLAPLVGCAHSGAQATDGSYTVVREAGKELRVRLGKGPMPPEFPAGLPLHPDAEMSATSYTEDQVVVALSTATTAESVFAFYRQQTGLSELSEVEVYGMRVLLLEHAATGKKVQVVVELGSKPPTSFSLVVPR